MDVRCTRITRAQLIDLRLLVGTDVHPGVNGIGKPDRIVTADAFYSMPSTAASCSWTLRLPPSGGAGGARSRAFERRGGKCFAGGVHRHMGNPAISSRMVSTDSAPSRAPCPSACEPHRERIEVAVRIRRNAMAIWQNLVDDIGFASSGDVCLEVRR